MIDSKFSSIENMDDDSARNRCRLYLITPPRFDPLPFADLLASALDADDVACVQMRLKDADDDTILRAIDVLRPVSQARGVAFLLNDRVDLAIASGCDGVHLGQEDGDHEAARKMLGPNILGLTCHDSRHLAMRAGEAGADYVAFGAFFPTNTKDTAYRPTRELLEWWSTIMEIPCVAIGGITAANCSSLVQAGASFLAVIGAVWDHSNGPRAGVQSMNAAIKAAESRS